MSCQEKMTEELDNKTISMIVSAMLESNKRTKLPRSYIGMSQIGHSCARYLWFYFRWAQKISLTARDQRIFDRGSLEEGRIIKYLTDVDLVVHDTQNEFIDLEGHLRGHNDGVLKNIPGHDASVLSEFKTMAEKYFKVAIKKGLKEAYPLYFYQLILYLHYSGLKKALIICSNKNTEEYHVETISAQPDLAWDMINKAQDVINSEVPPKRLSENPKFFECNWCEFLDVCHYQKKFDKNCRTCMNVEPAPNYKWHCKAKNEVLEIEDQKTMVVCNSTLYNMLKV